MVGKLLAGAVEVEVKSKLEAEGKEGAPRPEPILTSRSLFSKEADEMEVDASAMRSSGMTVLEKALPGLCSKRHVCCVEEFDSGEKDREYNEALSGTTQRVLAAAEEFGAAEENASSSVFFVGGPMKEVELDIGVGKEKGAKQSNPSIRDMSVALDCRVMSSLKMDSMPPDIRLPPLLSCSILGA